jgi:hypothetical protein
VNFNDTPATGREDAVIFWCRKCGNRTGPKPWPVQEVGIGSTICCGSGMRYVAYQAGVEDVEAHEIAKGVRMP